MATRVSALPGVQTAATAADTDIFAIEDGTDAKQLALGELKEYVTLAHGQIAITNETGTTYVNCAADGSTDDWADIKTAVAAAIADLPALIEFGEGDYSLSDGVPVQPTAAGGLSGLTIKGQGPNVTKLAFRNATLGSGTGSYYMFLIEPAVDPTTETTYSEFISNITVEGIGFLDATPFDHQTRNGSTTGSCLSGTGGFVMTVTGTPFTANYYDESAGAALYMLVNETDESIGQIVSNTTSSITVRYMAGGTDNLWENGDTYSIHSIAIGNPEGNEVEESHAVFFKYCMDSQMINVCADSFGDEALNMQHAKRCSINNSKVINSPTMSFSGCAIAIQQGCEDITVAGNMLSGSDTFGTMSEFRESSGVNLECIDAFEMSSITIANNQIRDFGSEGILANCSSDLIKNVSATGNNIQNCRIGFGKGGQQDLNNVVFTGNNILDLRSSGALVTSSQRDASDNVIMVVPAGHTISVGDSIDVTDLLGFTEDPNGTAKEVTAVTPTSVTFVHTGTTETFTAGQGKINAGDLDTQGFGMYLPGGVSQTFDFNISSNNFTNCIGGGAKVLCTASTFSDNIFKTCGRGLWLFTVTDCLVDGGIMDSCGNGTTYRDILDGAGGDTSTTVISNLTVRNSGTTSSCVRGVGSIVGCTFQAQAAATSPENYIFDSRNVINSIVVGGIRVDAAAGGRICNNQIGWADTGGALSADAVVLAATNDNWVVTGNVIDMSPATNNQYCIDCAGDNCVITGNVLINDSTGTALNLTGSGTIYQTAAADPLNYIS